jgi:hypothetical protein
MGNSGCKIELANLFLLEDYPTANQNQVVKVSMALVQR